MRNSILPAAWNIPDKVKGNCYVFSLGPRQTRGGYTNRVYKARPGDKCKTTKKCCYKDKEFDFSNCEEFAARILCDNPKHVSKLRRNVLQSTTLPSGYHMFCALLSPEGNQDFHFARRFFVSDLSKSDIKKLLERSPEPARTQFSTILKNPNRYIWLHQRGWMAGGPILHDASNALIRNIKTCDMKYDDLNYNRFCSFFKVKTRKATVTDRDEQ